MWRTILEKDYDDKRHGNFKRCAEICKSIIRFEKPVWHVIWIGYIWDEFNELDSYTKEDHFYMYVDSSVDIGDFYCSDNNAFIKKDQWKNFFNDDELLIFLREERDELLSRSDKYIIRQLEQKALGVDTSISEDEYIALLSYRQALRDYPTTCTNPRNPVWPEMPSFMLPKL